MNNNREYRNIEVLKETEKDESYIVEGYATVYDVPYELFEIAGKKYYEKIAPAAFKDADLSDVIMQYDHTGKVFARCSNNTLTIDVNDVKGLFIRADLSKSEKAKELYHEIKNGLITKMSIGFIVDEEKIEGDTRTITKIKKLYDVSAVSIPANDNTEIYARNLFNGAIEKEKQELLKSRKKRKLILLFKILEK